MAARWAQYVSTAAVQLMRNTMGRTTRSGRTFKMMASSAAVKGSLHMDGASWLCHLQEQRPVSNDADLADD